MSEPIRVLHVDTSPLDRQAARDVLENHAGGFQVDEAASRGSRGFTISTTSFA